MDEATIEDMPNSKNPASDGWFVLNLAKSAAFRNEVKGGAVIPLLTRRTRTGPRTAPRCGCDGRPNSFYEPRFARKYVTEPALSG
jgi:hypothetical protein